MAIYTVHEPPRRWADAATHANRFLFVRDGFHVWAFLTPPLWMLWHRLWLVLTLSIVAMVAIDLGLRAAGLSAGALLLVDVLIALLIGAEASSLRRWTLARRGWRTVSVISAGSEEEAEHRFFERWTPSAALDLEPGHSPPYAGMGRSRSPSEPGVLGLFPEPGARRP